MPVATERLPRSVQAARRWFRDGRAALRGGRRGSGLDMLDMADAGDPRAFLGDGFHMAKLSLRAPTTRHNRRAPSGPGGEIENVGMTVDRGVDRRIIALR
jgi:hypothetical protein